jgi:hypothetical protein
METQGPSPETSSTIEQVRSTLGDRRSVLLGLRRQDVDLAGATLTVRNVLQSVDGSPVLVEPKTKRSLRTIALSAGALGALKEHRRCQAEERLASGPRWDDWGLVFASAVGTPLDATNVTRRLQRVIRQVSDRRIEEGYRVSVGLSADAPLSDAEATELAAIRDDPRHPFRVAHGLPTSVSTICGTSAQR